jgi:Spy/CpxP family protein refolding chaperone
MKKYYLAAMVICLCASPMAFSKGYGPYMDSPQQHVERLSDRLGLDDAQQQQVLQILTETQAQRDALHEQMKALRDQTHEKIAGVLTTEQQELFTSMGPGRHPGQPKPCRNQQ